MGFGIETKTPKSWLIMMLSWWCTPPLKGQNCWKWYQTIRRPRFPIHILYIVLR